MMKENKKEHEELLEKILDSNDIHWQEQNKLKKRVKRTNRISTLKHGDFAPTS